MNLKVYVTITTIASNCFLCLDVLPPKDLTRTKIHFLREDIQAAESSLAISKLTQ